MTGQGYTSECPLIIIEQGISRSNSDHCLNSPCTTRAAFDELLEMNILIVTCIYDGIPYIQM